MAAGLIAFILLSQFLPFKDKLFSESFKKDESYAAEIEALPTVDLKIYYKDQVYDDLLSIPQLDSPVTLKWETKGDPDVCMGKSWGSDDIDTSWSGSKDPTGGQFVLTGLGKNNPYVYSINCSSKKGDALGDSVTVNLGTKKGFLSPSIASIKIKTDMDRIVENPTTVNAEDLNDVDLSWTSLNTQTPYSICVTTGTWGVGYKNGTTGDERALDLPANKISRFRIFCSNETSTSESSVTFLK